MSNSFDWLFKKIEEFLLDVNIWQEEVRDYWRAGEGRKKLHKLKIFIFICGAILICLSLIGIIGMIIGLVKQSYMFILITSIISIAMLLVIRWAGDSSARVIHEAGELFKGIMNKASNLLPDGGILEQKKNMAKGLAVEIAKLFKPFTSISLVLAFISALTILIGFQNYNKFWVMAALAIALFFLVRGLYFETDNKLLGKAATAFIFIGIICFYTRYPLDSVTAKLFGCGDIVKTAAVSTPQFKLVGKKMVPDTIVNDSTVKVVSTGDIVQVIDQRNLWKKLNGEKMIAARLPDSATGRFINPDTVWIIANDLKKAKTKTVLPKKRSYSKGNYPLSFKKGDRFNFTVGPRAKGYWFNTSNCQNDSLEIYSVNGQLLMKSWLPNQNLKNLPRSGVAVARADMDNVTFSVN